VYVPSRRKEVRFFDVHYERGLDWYEGFFPPEAEASHYLAIGEFSPTYLSCPQCPNRIASVPSIARLIVILRNPVDRAYSRYGFHVRYGGFSGTFEDLLVTQPYVLEEGYYSQGIKNYLQKFAREHLLVLIYEQAIGAHLPETKTSLARFLQIPSNGFPEGAGLRRVNVSRPPQRGRSLYAWLTTISHTFQDCDVNLDWVIGLAKKAGLRSVFGDSGRPPPMQEGTRRYLTQLYREEVDDLEELLLVDLSCWR
jgi:hypothetical protein